MMNISRNNIGTLSNNRMCNLCSHDLMTRKGRRTNLLKIIILSTIPVLVLQIIIGMQVYQNELTLSRTKSVKDSVLFSLETGNVVHFTQIERGATALYVSSKGDTLVYENLRKNYLKTDYAIGNLSKWPSMDSPPHFVSREKYFKRIKGYRETLDPLNVTVKQVIQFYTNDNALIINWVAESIKLSTSGSFWQQLVAYHMLILSKEQAGIERALGSSFFARGHFKLADSLWYMEKKTLGETYLERCKQYSSKVRSILDQRFKDSPLDSALSNMRLEILSNNITTASVISGVLWFDNMTAYINILKGIQDTMGKDIVVILESEISSMQESLIISIVVMVGTLVLMPIVIALVYKVTQKLQTFAVSLQEKTSELDKERQKSENILHQMLPVSVAKRLMKEETVIPESFSSVTIYFSDICGFTDICSRITSIQVVEMLNLLYKTLDDLLEKYDVYKVETIGDAYMVASGLPQRNGTRHIAEISFLAVDVVDTISNLAIPHLSGETFQVRIGINTGPVVAGVVGTKMPRYCLFGDTVNVASRMESSGMPLKIHLSPTSYVAICQYPGFIVKERGGIEIKGKGLMRTYWLHGIMKGYRYNSKTAWMATEFNEYSRIQIT